MPSGKVHAEVTLAAASLVYVWGMSSGETLTLAAAAAAGTAAGLIITPDLDVVGTRADHLIKRNGFIPWIVWTIFWRPYAALLPHRHYLSHGIILGTFIRLIYIAVPLWLLGILPEFTPGLARAVIGLTIADNLHIGLDFIISGVNKYDPE